MKKHNACPECEAEFEHRPGLVGQTIRCRTCSHLFVVTGPSEPASSRRDNPATPAPAPPLPPRKTRRDDDEDDRPRAKRNSYGRLNNRRDREEDDKPRNKAARYREQDDEAGGGRGGNTKPRKRAGGLMIGLVACLGALFITALLVGVVLVLWPSSPKVNSRDAAVATNSVPGKSFTPAQPTKVEEPRNIDDILNQMNNQRPPGRPNIKPPEFFVPPPVVPQGGNIVIKPLSPAPADALPSPANFVGNVLEVSTPHRISRVVPAGSGRYLLLSHETHQKLSVLDVTSAKIVKTITLGQNNVLIAGGHDYFVAWLPGTNEFQRFNLNTLEPDQKIRNPITGEIAAIGMGAASNGPVVICLKEKRGGFPDENKTIQFLDPKLMTPGNHLITGVGGRLATQLGVFGKPIALNVSGNGGVFTAWTMEFPLGVYSYVFGENGRVCRYADAGGPRTAFPSGDGKSLFSEGRIYGPDAKPVTEQVGGHNHKIWYLPAVTGPDYLMIEEKNRAFADSTLAFEMRSAADKNTSRIPQVDGTEGLVDWLRGRWLPMEQHFFLIPPANVLAVRPPRNPNSIILCKIR